MFEQRQEHEQHPNQKQKKKIKKMMYASNVIEMNHCYCFTDYSCGL